MKLSPINEVHIDELLDRTLRAGCRELHLRAGQSPLTRACRGTAQGVLPYEAFSPLDIQQIVYAILTEEQIRQFEREGNTSFSYSVARWGAFEVHMSRLEAALEADFVVAES